MSDACILIPMLLLSPFIQVHMPHPDLGGLPFFSILPLSVHMYVSSSRIDALLGLRWTGWVLPIIGSVNILNILDIYLLGLKTISLFSSLAVVFLFFRLLLSVRLFFSDHLRCYILILCYVSPWFSACQNLYTFGSGCRPEVPALTFIYWMESNLVHAQDILGIIMPPPSKTKVLYVSLWVL